MPPKKPLPNLTDPALTAAAPRRRAAILVIAAVCATTQTYANGEATAEFEAPWVGTSLADVVPATAEIQGAGFEPNRLLWLDLTDPLGGVFTTQIVSDSEGRIAVAVAADQPGTHHVRVRDADDFVITEDEIFFAAD